MSAQHLEMAGNRVDLDSTQAKMVVQDIPDRPGSAAAIFRALATADVPVDMIMENVSREGVSTLTFTLPETDRHKAFEVIEKAFEDIGGGQVMTQGPIAKLSVSGPIMRTRGGAAARLFGALASAGINIEMICTLEQSTAIVVSVDRADQAMEAVRAIF